MEREIGEENDKGFANLYPKVSRNHKATKILHEAIKEYTKMKGQYTQAQKLVRLYYFTLYAGTLNVMLVVPH